MLSSARKLMPLPASSSSESSSSMRCRCVSVYCPSSPGDTISRSSVTDSSAPARADATRPLRLNPCTTGSRDNGETAAKLRIVRLLRKSVQGQKVDDSAPSWKAAPGVERAIASNAPIWKAPMLFGREIFQCRKE